MQESPTSITKLEALYAIAKQHLQHVYLGNVSNEKRSSTFCNNCGELLIVRNGYKTILNGINEKGGCKNCQTNNTIIL